MQQFRLRKRLVELDLGLWGGYLVELWDHHHDWCSVQIPHDTLGFPKLDLVVRLECRMVLVSRSAAHFCIHHTTYRCGQISLPLASSDIRRVMGPY